MLLRPHTLPLKLAAAHKRIYNYRMQKAMVNTQVRHSAWNSWCQNKCGCKGIRNMNSSCTLHLNIRLEHQ